MYMSIYMDIYIYTYTRHPHFGGPPRTLYIYIYIYTRATEDRPELRRRPGRRRPRRRRPVIAIGIITICSSSIVVIDDNNVII